MSTVHLDILKFNQNLFWHELCREHKSNTLESIISQTVDFYTSQIHDEIHKEITNTQTL
jgi:hypothetical protein